MLATAGIHTPWMHQWRAMTRDRNVHDVNPREQHIANLITLIQRDHANGHLTIVIKDFNEDPTDQEKTGIKLLQSTCALVNAFHLLTGAIPSSRRNHRRVFHIFIHPHLLNYVNHIGVLDETAGFSTSDHLPFFIDLDRSLLNSKIVGVVHNQNRILKSTNIESVTK